LERIALTTSLDTEIRSRTIAVLEGDSTLADFYRWFVPATWQVEQTGNAEAIRLTHDIAHLLNELSTGGLTFQEARRELQRAISTDFSSARHHIA
jgi:hypothetical protein